MIQSQVWDKGLGTLVLLERRRGLHLISSQLLLLGRELQKAKLKPGLGAMALTLIVWGPEEGHTSSG